MKVIVGWAIERAGMKRERRHNLWKFLHLEGRQVMSCSGSKQKGRRRTKRVQCHENKRREFLEQKNR